MVLCSDYKYSKPIEHYAIFTAYLDVYKRQAMEENEVRYEAIDCDDADYVIVAFGSSARICSATVEMARAEGIKVGLLRPITLYPFPTKAIADLAKRGVKGFLSAELNAGQMVCLLYTSCQRPDYPQR